MKARLKGTKVREIVKKGNVYSEGRQKTHRGKELGTWTWAEWIQLKAWCPTGGKSQSRFGCLSSRDCRTDPVKMGGTGGEG